MNGTDTIVKKRHRSGSSDEKRVMQKMMERSEESENRKDKLVQRGFAVGN